MNPRALALLKLATVLLAAVVLILIFPKALGFVEMGAREVRYLWWLILLVALGAWLIWVWATKRSERPSSLET